MLRRFLALVIVASVMAGCGGGGGAKGKAVFARQFTAGGKTMYGLRAYLQSDKDVYVEGGTIKLMCALKNVSGRDLFLESTGNWGLGRILVQKVGGAAVTVEEKRARVRREYTKLGGDKGKAVRWFVKGLDTKLWKVPDLDPGKYTLTLVYDAKSAKQSEVWDRLSAAGGPYEGGELWTLKAVSNPVMITVKSLEEALGRK